MGSRQALGLNRLSRCESSLTPWPTVLTHVRDKMAVPELRLLYCSQPACTAIYIALHSNLQSDCLPVTCCNFSPDAQDPGLLRAEDVRPSEAEPGAVLLAGGLLGGLQGL